MGLFNPEFDGQLTVERLPDDFAARIQRRLEEGLLMSGHRGPRTDYRVRSMDGQAIRFAAHGFLTTYNVGLNDVTVSRSGRNQVQYHVSYWGWTLAAVAHGAILGLVLLLCYFLVPALPRDVSAYPYGPALFWGMVGFFGLLWPWLLSAFHRPFAERALQRILRETFSGPTAERSGTDDASGVRRAS